MTEFKPLTKLPDNKAGGFLNVRPTKEQIQDPLKFLGEQEDYLNAKNLVSMGETVQAVVKSIFEFYSTVPELPVIYLDGGGNQDDWQQTCNSCSYGCSPEGRRGGWTFWV